MNFPNIYSLILPTKEKNYVYAPNDYIAKIGIIVTILVFVVIALLVLYKKIEFNKERIITFGLWSVVLSTFLLPQMHDRYLFVGDILSILYFAYNRDKIYIPIGIQLVSLYSYSCYLFKAGQIPIQLISFMYLIIIIKLTIDIYRKHLKISV